MIVTFVAQQKKKEKEKSKMLNCFASLRLQVFSKADLFSCQGLCEQVIMVLQIMEAEGIEPNIVMLNMLINAFGNAGRYMEAISVYHHIKESVSITSWQWKYHHYILLMQCFFNH